MIRHVKLKNEDFVKTHWEETIATCKVRECYKYSSFFHKRRTNNAAIKMTCIILVVIVACGSDDSTSPNDDTNGTSFANHVVVNEIEMNPSGTDAGNEWVELYNPTSSSVDISGWKIKTTGGKRTEDVSIPSGTSIKSNGFYCHTFPSQWLDNENNESAILFNAQGSEVDRTPGKNDTSNDSRSWTRVPNGQDTNSASDFQFKTSTKCR